MNIRLYWKSLNSDQKQNLANAVGTSTAFMSQVVYGHRSCSETLALAIERETGGQVTVAELRPQFAHDLKRSGYVRQPDKSSQAAA
jgi:DNA-binding transcriptional regulator YdaS (Cro superfamily)